MQDEGVEHGLGAWEDMMQLEDNDLGKEEKETEDSDGR